MILFLVLIRFHTYKNIRAIAIAIEESHVRNATKALDRWRSSDTNERRLRCPIKDEAELFRAFALFREVLLQSFEKKEFNCYRLNGLREIGTPSIKMRIATKA